MLKAIFSHCRFYLFADANAPASRWLYLHKSNAAMGGWLTDFHTDVTVLGEIGQTIALSF